jgi:riboflavin kinase/FMN adenylyltransferase
VRPNHHIAGQGSRSTFEPFARRMIEGTVELGDQRGRTIGFPTANIRLGLRHADIPDGVYASIAELEDGRTCTAATSIGRRPTFYLEGERLCEVHLIDFGDDIYGRHLRVRLLAFLRGQQRFETIADLQHQLQADVEMTARLCEGAELQWDEAATRE